MYATFKIVLFARSRNDGSRPVYLRCTYKGKSKHFPLNLYAFPDEWDKKTARFKKSRPTWRQENDLLLKIESRAADALLAMKRDNTLFTFARFEQATFGGETPIMSRNLAAYTKSVSAELESEGNVGNATFYASLASVISAYQSDCVLADIDLVWVERFERHLRRDRGNGDGGVSATLRTLRAVCNRAIKDGAPSEWYPFRNYKIKKATSQSRALSLDDFRKIESFAPTPGSREEIALDLFRLSFYFRGANMADLARLTTENVVGSRLEFVRHKTRRKKATLFSVPISEKAAAILERYKGKNDPYLLPIIKPGSDEKAMRRQIGAATKSANYGIREVARSAGVEPLKIEFYTARHTYATALKTKGIPIEIISELLGHSDLKTTGIYLARFDSEVLDAADKALDT